MLATQHNTQLFAYGCVCVRGSLSVWVLCCVNAHRSEPEATFTEPGPQQQSETNKFVSITAHGRKMVA